MSEPTPEQRAAEIIVELDRASAQAAAEEWAEHPPFTERPDGMETMGARVRRLGIAAITPVLAAAQADASRAAEAKAYREAAEMADVACSDVEADARKDYLAARDSGDERMQHFNGGREVGAGECRDAIEARARPLAGGR